MAAFLYRVGRFAFRHRWSVALAWLVVLGGVVAVGLNAPAAPPDNTTIPGAEFQNANNLIRQGFHANPNGASAQLVFVAPHGQKITATRFKTVIGEVVVEAAHAPEVVTASTPFQTGQVSRDGSTAIADISYSGASGNLPAATTNALQNAAQAGRDAGLTVEIGGDALSSTPPDTAVVFSLIAAAVILLITFGALAAAGMPLLTALAGVGLSVMGILALAKPLGLSGTTESLAIMLGLALGIDYALFIVSRYREERTRGREPREAAGAAVGTAGSAVVFAGVTVIIALVGLSVIGIPAVTKMGLAAAATVAISVLVALTLVPALLGFWPRAVLSRAARRGRAVQDGAKPNMGSRWARFVLRYPVPLLLLSVAGLSTIAVPALHMRLGDGGNAILPTSDTARRAYDDISRAFGPGYNGQLTIVVTANGAASPKTAAAQVAGKIAATPGVVSVTPPQFNAAGTMAIITATPATAPDAQQTTNLVNTVRGERPAISAATGASYLVTGLTASNIDIAAKVGGALIPYLLTVVGLAFLLLLIVFRSVLVPLKATAGFVLSVLAGLGALTAVFQWGWLGKVLGVPATGPIQSFMPVFLIGISFGLAMDYQVFLVTRIRESYASGEPPRPAVVSGFSHSARVVTAAALIMISVFAGFIGNSAILVKEIGFGLASTILLDAFVIRMTFVPAVLAMLGKAAWWLPRWLNRIVPQLDIEGQALDERLTSAAAQASAPARDPAVQRGPASR